MKHHVRTLQNEENRVLRNFIEVAREYITARDALWSVGPFDRIFRFGRCVELLNQYDKAKDNVRNAFQEVKNVAIAKTGADIVGGENTPQNPAPLLTVEEFEMLLNTPPILRNHLPVSKDKP